MSESSDAPTSISIPEQGAARSHAVALSVLELTDCESAVLTRVALAGSALREPEPGSEWSGRELSDAVDALAHARLVDCAQDRAEATSHTQFSAAVLMRAQYDQARADLTEAAKREDLFAAILRRSGTTNERLGDSGDLEGEFLELIEPHRLFIHAYPPSSFEWPNADEIDDRAIAHLASQDRDQRTVDIVSAQRLRLPRDVDFFERVAAAPQSSVHVTDSVPMRLVLLDDSAAVVPVDPHDHQKGATVVRHPDAVALVGIHLAVLMATARPLGAWGVSGAALTLSEREAAVVRLLSAGLTDDSIAKRLGVADRTVRRAVAELMAKVGADSRFALAVACARQGLL